MVLCVEQVCFQKIFKGARGRVGVIRKNSVDVLPVTFVGSPKGNNQ